MEPVTLLTQANQPQASAAVDDIRKINAEKQKIGIYGFAGGRVGECASPPRERQRSPGQHPPRPAQTSRREPRTPPRPAETRASIRVR
jgi:hypothetical protein